MSEVTYQAVVASTVQEGDLYANGATVTKVVTGPETDADWGAVDEGMTVIHCGASFSTKGKSTRSVVIGRRHVNTPSKPNQNDSAVVALSESKKHEGS